MNMRFAEAGRGVINLKEKRFGVRGHRPVKSSDTRVQTKYLEPERREQLLTEALYAHRAKLNILTCFLLCICCFK